MVVLHGELAVVSTLAGGVSGTNEAFADASGTNAGFNQPFGVAVDASGNVFVADRFNQRIRKVTAGGGMLVPEGFSLALFSFVSHVCVCEFLCVCASACIWMFECVLCVCGFESMCPPFFMRMWVCAYICLGWWLGSVLVGRDESRDHMSVGTFEIMGVCVLLTLISSTFAFTSHWQAIRAAGVMLLPSDCVCASRLQGCRVVPATPSAPSAAPVVQHACLAFIVPPVRTSIG